MTARRPSETRISRGMWVTATLVVVALHMIAPIALCGAVVVTLHKYNIIRSFW